MHDHVHDDHHHDHPHHHHDAHKLRAQPVVLDLGEGIGALIVRTDPDRVGTEIEISPSGDDGTREHKEVLRRTMGRDTATVLVYDNLHEGDYTLWVDELAPIRNIHVAGGKVAEIEWRRPVEPSLASG